MRKLYIIGIGAGNPEYLTMQAIKALNLVDVFFFMNKGDAKEDLVDLRKAICEQYITQHPYRVVQADDPVRDPAIADYTARVEHWHQQRVLIYEGLIQRELSEDQCGAFLVWGDPSLYDSTLRIIDQITGRANVAFAYEVIPGITSIQALAARHKIPLNGIGESVLITTGRQLATGLPEGVSKIVVMLDGQCAFKNIPHENLDIFWGAYLGMGNEILLSGPLSELSDEIEASRNKERAKSGWIMDTYLLSVKKRKE
jgi:precorrin-6A synthase